MPGRFFFGRSVSAELNANHAPRLREALTHMDEATQQNPALVEENAATAKTLADQSAAMGEQMGFFRTEDARRSTKQTSGPRAAA